MEKVQARPDPIQELEDMARMVSKMLVDTPDEIVVNTARGNGFAAFEIIANRDDTGTLVGRHGKHVEALRTLMMAAGAVRKIRVTVQVVSRDHDGLSPR